MKAEVQTFFRECAWHIFEDDGFTALASRFHWGTCCMDSASMANKGQHCRVVQIFHTYFTTKHLPSGTFLVGGTSCTAPFLSLPLLQSTLWALARLVDKWIRFRMFILHFTVVRRLTSAAAEVDWNWRTTACKCEVQYPTTPLPHCIQL